LRTLLDAATALGFEQERLQDGGISLISALDDRFPAVLRNRLGTACPPFLLVAGPIDWLDRPGLGVVGSRDADDGLLDIARRSAELAVSHGWPVVSGLARGVDQASMAGALDAGGVVIGVPAEGITKVSRSADIRRRVHAGELCIASPYAPDAPFRAGNAMGRNKIIYALSQVTFVVSSDVGSGGTWAGAKEALERRFARVAVWTGTVPRRATTRSSLAAPLRSPTSRRCSRWTRHCLHPSRARCSDPWSDPRRWSTVLGGVARGLAVQEVGSEAPPNRRVACSGRSARNRPSASTSASSGADARLIEPWTAARMPSTSTSLACSRSGWPRGTVAR
jgi:hypothetical protein